MASIENFLTSNNKTYSEDYIRAYKNRIDRLTKQQEEVEKQIKEAQELEKQREEAYKNTKAEYGVDDLNERIKLEQEVWNGGVRVYNNKTGSYEIPIVSLKDDGSIAFTNLDDIDRSKTIYSKSDNLVSQILLGGSNLVSGGLTKNVVQTAIKDKYSDEVNSTIQELEKKKEELTKTLGEDRYNQLLQEAVTNKKSSTAGYIQDVEFGNLQVKRNTAWDQYFKDGTYVSRQKAEELDKQLEEYQANNLGIGKQTLSSTANYLPQLAYQTKKNILGTSLALGAKYLGAKLGAPEIGNIAAKWIYTATSVASGFDVTYEQTRGGEFGDMLKLGIPEDIAKDAAQNSALWQSIIEEGETAIDIYNAFKIPQSENVTNGLKQFFKNWGVNIVTEFTEEGSQSVVGFIYEKDAALRAGIDTSGYTTRSMIEQAWEEGKGGAEVGATMYLADGLPHIVVGTIANNRAQHAYVQMGPTREAIIQLPTNVDDYGNETVNKEKFKTILVEAYDKSIEAAKTAAAENSSYNKVLEDFEKGKEQVTSQKGFNALVEGLDKSLDAQSKNKKQNLTEQQRENYTKILKTEQEEIRNRTQFKNMELNLADDITQGQKNVANFVKKYLKLNVAYYTEANNKSGNYKYKHRGFWVDGDVMFVNANVRTTKNTLSVAGHEWAHENYFKSESVRNFVNSYYTDEDAKAYVVDHGRKKEGDFISNADIAWAKEEMYADDVGEFLSQPTVINMIEANDKSAIKEVKNVLANFIENTSGYRPQFDSLQQYNMEGTSILNGVPLANELQTQVMEEIKNNQAQNKLSKKETSAKKTNTENSKKETKAETSKKENTATRLTPEQKSNDSWYREQKADNKSRDAIQKSLALRMNKGVNSPEVKVELDRLEKKYNEANKAKRSAYVENINNNDYNNNRGEINDTQRVDKKTVKRQETSKNASRTRENSNIGNNKSNERTNERQRNIQPTKGLSSKQNPDNSRKQEIDSTGRKLIEGQPEFYKDAYRNSDGVLPRIYIVTRGRFLKAFLEFRSQEFADRYTGFGNQNAVFGSDSLETASSYATGQITDIKSENDKVEHPSVGGNNIRYNVYMNLKNPAVFDYRNHNFRHYIDKESTESIEKSYSVFDVFFFYSYQDAYDEAGWEKFINIFDKLDNNNYNQVLSNLNYKDFGYSIEVKYHFDNFINGIKYLIDKGLIDVDAYRDMNVEERELALQKLMGDVSKQKVLRTDDLVNKIIDYNYSLLDTIDIETAREMLIDPDVENKFVASIVASYNKTTSLEQFEKNLVKELQQSKVQELSEIIEGSLGKKGNALKIAIKSLYEEIGRKTIDGEKFANAEQSAQVRLTKRTLDSILNYWEEDHLLNMSQEDILDVGGFDGLVLQNVVDYGGGIFERIPGNDYVAFDSSQIKLVDNLNPTSNREIHRSAEIDDGKKKNTRTEKWKGKAKKAEQETKTEKRIAKGRGRALRWSWKKEEQQRKQKETWKARTKKREIAIMGLRAKAKAKDTAKKIGKLQDELLTKMKRFEKSETYKFMTDEQKKLYAETFGNIYRKAKSKTDKTRALEKAKAKIANELLSDPDIVVNDRIRRLALAPTQKTLSEFETVEQMTELIDAFEKVVEDTRKQQELVGLSKNTTSKEEKENFAAAVKELKDKWNKKTALREAKRNDRSNTAVGRVQNALGTALNTTGRTLNKVYKNALSTIETQLLNMAGGNRNSKLMDIYNNLDRGVSRERGAYTRLNRILSSFLNDKKYAQLRKAIHPKNGWKDTGIVVKDIDGVEHKLYLNEGLMISLAMHYMQDQSLKHISGAIVDIAFDEDGDLDLKQREGGGITIPNMELAKAGRTAEAISEGYIVKLSKKQLAEILDAHTDKDGNTQFGSLSNEANELVKTLKDEFFEQTYNYSDEVYYARHGYHLRRGDNYFPLVANKAYIYSHDKDKNLTASSTREAFGIEDNASFIKERNDNAFNPIVLENIGDVITRMIDGVSKYYGYEIALHNNRTLMNIKTDDINIEDALAKLDPSFKSNYRALEGFISGTMRHPKDLFSWARGKHAEFTLSLNPGSWVKQLLSVPTTAKYFTVKEMMEFVAGGEVALYETMKAYLESKGDYEKGSVLRNFVRYMTDDLDYRNLGFGLADMSDVMENKSVFQKIDIIRGVARLDMLGVNTVTRMFLFAELNRRGLLGDNLTRLSADEADAVFQSVGRDLEHFLRVTQPDFSQVNRANITRNSGVFARFATMYSTPALQMANNLMQSLSEFNYARSTGDKELMAQSRNSLIKSAAGIVVASVGSVLISRAFSQLFKGKDDDEDDFELGKEIVVSMLAPTLVLDDVARGLMGMQQYDSQVPELIAFDAVTSIASNINGLIIGKEETKFNKVKNIIRDLGTLTGLPTRDLMKIARTALMYADSDLYYDVALRENTNAYKKWLDGNTTQDTKDFYKAYTATRDKVLESKYGWQKADKEKGIKSNKKDAFRKALEDVFGNDTKKVNEYMTILGGYKS